MSEIPESLWLPTLSLCLSCLSIGLIIGLAMCTRSNKEDKSK
jgi:hypothetical protein